MARRYFIACMGGSSYGGSDLSAGSRDVETFATIREAKAYARRFWRSEPCADDVVFHFWRSVDPRGQRDPYPDEVWTRDEDGEPIRERA